MDKLTRGLVILITSLCFPTVTNAQELPFNYVLMSRNKLYLWKAAPGAPVLTALLRDDKWIISPQGVASGNEWQPILNSFNGNTTTEKWTDLLQKLSSRPGQVKGATTVGARTHAYVIALSNQLAEVIFERYKDGDPNKPEQTWTYFFQNDESTNYLWSRRISLNLKPDIGTSDIFGLSDGKKETLAALFQPKQGPSFEWDTLWNDWVTSALSGTDERPMPYQQEDNKAALFLQVPVSQKVLIEHIRQPVAQIETINSGPGTEPTSSNGLLIVGAIGLVLGILIPAGVKWSWRRLQTEPPTDKERRFGFKALKRIRFHWPVTFASAAPPADDEAVKETVRAFLRSVKEKSEEYQRSGYEREMKSLAESVKEPAMTPARLKVFTALAEARRNLSASALEMTYLIQERVLEKNFDDLIAGLFRQPETQSRRARRSGAKTESDSAEDKQFVKLGKAVSLCFGNIRSIKSDLHNLYPGKSSDEEWLARLPQAISQVEQDLTELKRARSLGEIAEAAQECFKKLKEARGDEPVHDLYPRDKSELAWLERLPGAVKEVDRTLSNQQSRINGIESSSSDLRKELDDSKRTVREKADAFNKAVISNNALTVEVNSLSTRETELERRLTAKEKKANELKEECDRLGRRVTTLEQERDNMLTTYANFPTRFMELQLTFKLADALTQGERSYLGGNSDMVSAAVAFFLIHYSLVQLCRAIVNGNEQMKNAMYANLRLIARRLPASRRNTSTSFDEALGLLPSSSKEGVNETQDTSVPRRDGPLFSALLAHLRGEPRVELAPFYFLGDSGAILRAS
jgi:hypothetical protein